MLPGTSVTGRPAVPSVTVMFPITSTMNSVNAIVTTRKATPVVRSEIRPTGSAISAGTAAANRRLGQNPIPSSTIVTPEA